MFKNPIPCLPEDAKVIWWLKSRRKIEMLNKTDELMIKAVYGELKNGNFPKFGPPETKCKKCMFFGITSFPGIGVVGCLGGWKKEGENSETR